LGSHVDDPGRCAGTQGVEQEVGQQEPAEVVDGQVYLNAVAGKPAFGDVCPGVVDQDMEAWWR
jgi:hypothetical protein